jgi:hypothetical protein
VVGDCPLLLGCLLLWLYYTYFPVAAVHSSRMEAMVFDRAKAD